MRMKNELTILSLNQWFTCDLSSNSTTAGMQKQFKEEEEERKKILTEIRWSYKLGLRYPIERTWERFTRDWKWRREKLRLLLRLWCMFCTETQLELNDVKQGVQEVWKFKNKKIPNLLNFELQVPLLSSLSEDFAGAVEIHSPCVLCPQCLRDRKSWWRCCEVQYVHTCRMWGVANIMLLFLYSTVAAQGNSFQLKMI